MWRRLLNKFFVICKKIDAIDISNVAIKKAKSLFTNIHFKQMDMRDISKIKKNNYDFISCFESLYYISRDSEREKILIDIKNKGKDNCVFCFQVTTIGENEYRRYFTYNGAVLFFKKHFNIIHHFPISIKNQNSFILLGLLKRVIRKLLRIVLGKSIDIYIYQKMLNKCKLEDAYQVIFILTKKLD